MDTSKRKEDSENDCSGGMLRPRLSPGPTLGLAAPSAPAGRCPRVKMEYKTGGVSLRSRVQAKACQTKGTPKRPRPLGTPGLF